MIKIRRSNERGHGNHGWLDSYHTFSFADYYDPEHSGFRSLRVINEDRVLGANGFDTHPHRDFEIISYVISGALKHEDSMGHAAVMKAGDMQHISAGTGIEHSEFNNSHSDPVHFLQIWVVPSRKGLTPSYSQASFSGAKVGELTLACSPEGRSGTIKINQDVELLVGKLAPFGKVTYPIKQNRYLWIQLIAGDLELAGSRLLPGDGVSVESESKLQLDSENGAHFLLFDLN